MALGYRTEHSPADWLVTSTLPFERLVTFGPAGFAACARLRFIPDPGMAGMSEADVLLTQDHPSDLFQAQQALHRLAEFTETPDECYFCVWDGYSDIVLPAGPKVELPHRSYALLRGTVRDIDDWARFFGRKTCAPPAFAWPADRSWCFTKDVDPHWAGIGATQAAVDALVALPGLDVIPARPDETPPAYR